MPVHLSAVVKFCQSVNPVKWWFVFSLLLVHLSNAQQLPNSDIFLIPVDQTESGVTLGAARMVSSLNKYDDHPSFSFDSQWLYFTAEADDYKTDIHAVYVPEFQTVEFVVTGNTSESWPQQKPDMTGLALVRNDGSARHLWFYGSNGVDRNLAPSIDNVDTYIWLNDNEIAVVLQNETRDLHIIDLSTNATRAIAANVGQSIAKVPSENAIYYTQTTDGLQRLMRQYYNSGKTDTLPYLPGGATYFCVAPDGSLWAANEGVIYRWPRAAGKWDIVQQLGTGALGGAYRVAISRDMKWLAVVTRMK